MGLTICKKYVELLGGHISVKSTPNKGSEFSFQIPLISDENLADNSNGSDGEKKLTTENIEDEKKETNFEPKENILKRKILVVEDDSTSRDVIYLFLKKMYDVSFAEDGEKALKLIYHKKFDLIIMDINLGSGINGIQVTETIRKTSGYERTPVIAATAFAMLGDKEKFLAQGFDHYISKPYLKPQLIKLISDVFSSN